MAAFSSERQRIQHLLRRAAFGYDSNELEEYVALGLGGAVSLLLAPEIVDDSATDDAVAALSIDLENQRAGLWQAWHVRLNQSRRPLLEKMTFFWHDHFATAISKVGDANLMHLQNETIRTHALGSFRDLLLAITRDPAMMKWLDNLNSNRKAPNENYARELMELHTMGEDNGYTETDIQEAARALTGWRPTFTKTDSGKRRFSGIRFDPRRHDPGTKTVLGITGALKDTDVVNILAERPETAEHLGRKLWRFFAVPDPTPKMIESTSRVYFATDGSIREIVRTILSSEEMYSNAAYRWRVKSPVELVVGATKALEISSTGNPERRFTRDMGQQLYNPPDPAGWRDGSGWVNSNTMLARSNFANEITRSRGGWDGFSTSGVQHALISKITSLLIDHGITDSADEIVDWTLDLLVGGDVDEASRNVLVEHLGGEHHFDFAQASKDGSLQGMVYLTLTMPLYQIS